MNYADKIAALVKTHIEDGAPIDGHITPLLKALGCRSMFEMPNGFVQCPENTPIEYEDLVRHTLFRVLRWNLSGAEPSEETSQAVLHGLSLNERWRACIADPDLVYALAATIIYLSSVLENSSVWSGSHFLKIWESEAASTVHFLLGAWFAEALPTTTPLTLDGMLVTFFGEVWTQLAWRGIDSTQWQLGSSIVLALRPPFVQGIPGYIPETIAVSLPQLEMS